MKWRFIPITAYLVLIYSFFYLPLLLLIAYSFNKSQYSLLWQGFSWHWYQELCTDSGLWTAAWHSLLLGVSAASIATIIALLAVVSFYLYRFWGRSFQYSLIFLLLLSPDIVMGISLLILFNFVGLSLGFWSLLCAHISLCLPFAIATIYGRIVSFTPDIIEAAKNLGANDFRIFHQIILPLLWSAIVAAWLLSFTLSLDDIIVSYFISGPEFEILSLRIYSMTRLGVTPTINALCTVTFALSLLLVLLAQFMLRKRP
jgi:spermidine/putrescine transport system permease protein